MNVLLAGAGGFIGTNIARALVAAGHRVTPVSRRNGIDFCRMQRAQDWTGHLRGIDAVINSVGIIGETGTQRFEPLHTLAPAALFSACAEAGVRRVVQISALGADETAFSRYHLSKRAADDALRGLDLEGFVLRPSLIYGKGGASSSLFMRLAALPLIPVVGDGRQQLQPIHIGDVVAAVLQCLVPSSSPQTLDLVGSEVFTLAEWLLTMRRALGLPPGRIVRVPMQLTMALARAGQWINPMLHPDNLRMLQAGSCADVQPLARFLGREPRRVEAGLFFSDVVTTGQSS